MREGNRAYPILQEQIEKNIPPPYQIDGNIGLTSGVAEMLLQSHHDTIYLLPALPKQYSKGYFKGLCARGGVSLGAFWYDHKLEKSILSFKNKGKIRIKYPGIQEYHLWGDCKIIEKSFSSVTIEVDDDSKIVIKR